MNGLDIVLAFLSIICFGAAFFIASRPISKASKSPVQPSWHTIEGGTTQPAEAFSSYSEETQ